MGMKKMMIVAVLIFCVFSSQMEKVEPQIDCYDSCSTGCVNSNTRLMLRCDRKCQIRCGPGKVSFYRVVSVNLTSLNLIFFVCLVWAHVLITLFPFFSPLLLKFKSGFAYINNLIK